MYLVFDCIIFSPMFLKYSSWKYYCPYHSKNQKHYTTLRNIQKWENLESNQSLMDLVGRFRIPRGMFLTIVIPNEIINDKSTFHARVAPTCHDLKIKAICHDELLLAQYIHKWITKDMCCVYCLQIISYKKAPAQDCTHISDFTTVTSKVLIPFKVNKNIVFIKNLNLKGTKSKIIYINLEIENRSSHVCNLEELLVFELIGWLLKSYRCSILPL